MRNDQMTPVSSLAELSPVLTLLHEAPQSVDLKTPGAGARYSFQSAAGQGPQPARVPGQVPRRNLCGRQNVELRARGLYAEPDQLDSPCLPSQAEPLPEPRCKLADIWEHARAKGASTQHAARIEYYRSSAGPAWRFELPDGSVRFSIYGDCRRELSRGNAGDKPNEAMLVRGDLVDDLPSLAARAPADATLVVFHTSVLYQVPAARRAAFVRLVRALPGHWVAVEAPEVLPYEGLPSPPDGALHALE